MKRLLLSLILPGFLALFCLPSCNRKPVAPQDDEPQPAAGQGSILTPPRRADPAPVRKVKVIRKAEKRTSAPDIRRARC